MKGGGGISERGRRRREREICEFNYASIVVVFFTALGFFGNIWGPYVEQAFKLRTATHTDVKLNEKTQANVLLILKPKQHLIRLRCFPGYIHPSETLLCEGAALRQAFPFLAAARG